MGIAEDSLSRPAPAPREMVELEANLNTIEENLRDVNTNFTALRKNHLELSELKNMLTKVFIPSISSHPYGCHSD